MMSKKGDLSLNIIIVAALALIVLVVLVVIFTGRIGIFKGGVDKTGDAELISMKIMYGQCHPGTTAESVFTSELSKAAGDGSESGKELARSNFKVQIDSCKGILEKASCSGSCTWS